MTVVLSFYQRSSLYIPSQFAQHTQALFRIPRLGAAIRSDQAEGLAIACLPFKVIYRVLTYAHDNPEIFGIDPEKNAVLGASAGGNHSAAMCLYARDHNGPKISMQSLNYLVMDFDPTLPTELYSLPRVPHAFDLILAPLPLTKWIKQGIYMSLQSAWK